MATVGAPQPWPSTAAIPSSASSDCVDGLCTPLCLQFCIYFSVPPPPLFTIPVVDGYSSYSSSSGSSSSSSSQLSPLMVALIALLATAFVLLVYYTAISKYCSRRRTNNDNSDWVPGGRDHDDQLQQFELESRLDQLIHQDSTSANFSSSQQRQRTSSGADSGLDERFIRSITVFTYERGDGLIDGTDCAVCLSEFRDFESLRLMPNCQHAFHVECIDSWLKSHSRCPLCRSTMIDSPTPQMDSSTEASVSAMRLVGGARDDVVVVVGDLEVVACRREIRDSDDCNRDSTSSNATKDGSQTRQQQQPQ